MWKGFLLSVASFLGFSLFETYKEGHLILVPENELKKILSEIEVRLKATYQYLGCLLIKIKLHIFSY